MAEYINFSESLEDDDYGIILSKNGKLKGIWVPETIGDDEEIPDTIAFLIKTVFGIDPNDKAEQITMH